MTAETNPLLKLTIDCVDGETSFIIITGGQKQALDFLVYHDHEGSSLYLEYGPNKIYDPETIYALLGFYGSEYN